MFRLSQKRNYDALNLNLKGFFKCSDCHLVAKRLRKVCENGHFFCEDCAEYILPPSKRCWICESPFAMSRLTVFNCMLDVMWNTSVESCEFLEKLVQVLECPVCYEETVTSLTVCDSGHNICRRCSLFSDGCPLCRDPFIPRCCINEIQRRLENALLDLPCCNQSNGCITYNDYSNLKNHVDKCSFASWNCGYEDCTWSGIVETSTKHAKEFHQTTIMKGRTIQMTLLLDNNLHLQLWNRKKDLDYKIFYKMTAQGLKLVIYCQKTKGEKIKVHLNYACTSSCYSVPFVELSENPTYFLTYECQPLVPADLVKTNVPSMKCFLQVEEGKWHSVVIFIIKVALMMIKFLTF